jgi:hypothetical protein
VSDNAKGCLIVLAIFVGLPVAVWLYIDRTGNDSKPTATTADTTWSAGEIDGYAACRFDGGGVASCVRRIKRDADRGTIEALQGCTEYAEDSDFEIDDYDDLSFYIQDCFERQNEPPP